MAADHVDTCPRDHTHRHARNGQTPGGSRDPTTAAVHCASGSGGSNGVCVAKKKKKKTSATAASMGAPQDPLYPHVTTSTPRVDKGPKKLGVGRSDTQGFDGKTAWIPVMHNSQGNSKVLSWQPDPSLICCCFCFCFCFRFPLASLVFRVCLSETPKKNE